MANSQRLYTMQRRVVAVPASAWPWFEVAGDSGRSCCGHVWQNSTGRTDACGQLQRPLWLCGVRGRPWGGSL